MTNRYLFRDRTPFTVTTIAMARGGLSWELKRCIESPLKDRFLRPTARAWAHETGQFDLKGIVPVMIDRKLLRHPNQPSHINGETMYVC